MSERSTTTIGFFNPNPYSIYLEVNEANVKVELKPGEYIRDREGKYINDPIFDDYVQPKGLSRATGNQQLPIRFIPRMVQPATRPQHAVTQAKEFVRNQDGKVMPVYGTAPGASAEVAANKNPIMGMTVERARKLGLIGKPRLVSEDYGVSDNTGLPPEGRSLPEMKYSIESQPKIRTAAPITAEMMEADQDLSAEEIARRSSLQRSLNQAASARSGENFDPARVRKIAPRPPVPLKAPDEPTPIEPGAPEQQAQKQQKKVSKSVKALKQAAKRVLPRKEAEKKEEKRATVQPEQPPKTQIRRIAKPVVDETTFPQEVPQENEQDGQVLMEGGDDSGSENTDGNESQSGVIQPIESGLPDPVMETPPTQGTGRRFICAADGRSFNYRSELERHVQRKYPKDMAEQLMRPYPPDPKSPANQPAG